MRIGFLGTGNLAVALAQAWAAVGHVTTFAGRNHDHAKLAADQVKGGSTVPGDRLAGESDVVVVAVAWTGLENILDLAGGPAGALAGKPVVECTNAVDYATGRLEVPANSAAELVASHAPGAHVVKALHLFAASSWPYTGPADQRPVVAVCGEDRSALDVVSSLIADLGGVAAPTGGLDTARQLEEAAGFVMRVAASGHNPRYAVPDIDLPMLSGQG